MASKILLGLGGAGIAGAIAASLSRAAFYRRLRAIERRIGKTPTSMRQHMPLPRAVAALAMRTATTDPAAREARFFQSGSMRQSPDSKELRFRARQIMAIAKPAFIWRADFLRFGAMHVADYLIDETAGLEGRLFGAFPVIRHVGGDVMVKGETMRYLAELPWAPDAILGNRQIEWREADRNTLVAAAGSGARRAHVRLVLGEDGLIAAAEADDRPRLEGRSTVERGWRGRFWDYRAIDGRKIPIRAEASWLIGSRELTYWRGTIRHWAVKPPI